MRYRRCYVSRTASIYSSYNCVDMAGKGHDQQSFDNMTVEGVEILRFTALKEQKESHFMLIDSSDEWERSFEGDWPVRTYTSDSWNGDIEGQKLLRYQFWPMILFIIVRRWITLVPVQFCTLTFIVLMPHSSVAIRPSNQTSSTSLGNIPLSPSHVLNCSRTSCSLSIFGFNAHVLLVPYVPLKGWRYLATLGKSRRAEGSS